MVYFSTKNTRAMAPQGANKYSNYLKHSQQCEVGCALALDIAAVLIAKARLEKIRFDCVLPLPYSTNNMLN